MAPNLLGRVRRPSWLAATVTAAAPTKRRRSISGIVVTSTRGSARSAGGYACPSNRTPYTDTRSLAALLLHDGIDNAGYRLTLPVWSLHQRDERFPFLDDIRGQLRPVAAADVLHRVDRSGRDEQDVARLDRRCFAADLILQRALNDVDDLFARMRVPWGDVSRVEIDAYLDDLASGNGEIVALQVGSFGSRLLQRRAFCRQTGSDDQHHYRPQSRRFHVESSSPNGAGNGDRGRRTTVSLGTSSAADVAYLSDLNPARSSPANSSGYSHIAKWPPRSTSLK